MQRLMYAESDYLAVNTARTTRPVLMLPRYQTASPHSNFVQDIAAERMIIYIRPLASSIRKLGKDSGGRDKAFTHAYAYGLVVEENVSILLAACKMGSDHIYGRASGHLDKELP